MLFSKIIIEPKLCTNHPPPESVTTGRTGTSCPRCFLVKAVKAAKGQGRPEASSCQHSLSGEWSQEYFEKRTGIHAAEWYQNICAKAGKSEHEILIEWALAYGVLCACVLSLTVLTCEIQVADLKSTETSLESELFSEVISYRNSTAGRHPCQVSITKALIS